MTSSIDVAKKLAGILNTTVGYLLDETDQENVLKDPDMLKRLNNIEKMAPVEKGHVLFALDALTQKIKIKILPLYKNKTPVAQGSVLYYPIEIIFYKFILRM